MQLLHNPGNIPENKKGFLFWKATLLNYMMLKVDKAMAIAVIVMWH